MKDMIRKLGSFGIVPVVVLNNAKDAKPLAKALCEGGLACAEVTFRTDAAEESIRIMTKEFPEMIVGAGTVLNVEQVKRAVDAGAQFIVSPGLDAEIVKYCFAHEIPVFPGACTPTEMQQAVNLGFDTVKFFPAEPMGGLKFIKAVAAPFTTLKFMPTGGVNTANVRDYLSYDRILCCGGSWMVKGSLIDAGEFDRIREMTAEACAIVKEIRG